jgi:hypothetical protein
MWTYTCTVYYSDQDNTSIQETLAFSNNTNKFKGELNKFLLLGSFYTIKEFYGWTSERNLYASYF